MQVESKLPEGIFPEQTYTHAGGFEDVATVAIAVEFSSVELKDPPLRLVVESN